MGLHILSSGGFLTSLVLSLFMLINVSHAQKQITDSDQDALYFALNLELLSAEHYSYGATGSGVDATAPELARGPTPVGGQKANLDPFFQDIFSQFALIQRGHLRAINRVIQGVERPLLNLSKELAAQVVNNAFRKTLNPPFDPYANSLNYLIWSYVISYFPPPTYVQITPQLKNPIYKSLVAGLLGVASDQETVIRGYLYERRDSLVQPYNVNTSTFIDRISELGNRLGKEGTKIEGLVVSPAQGAEGKIAGNVISADKDSLAYASTLPAILRIVYGTGDEHVPGAFFPDGANGRIARSFLP
ncbi:unnamed protein product [Sphenostylis stenocarpa]|uniref:Desiccation-related protein PCC13-62 n=1 Tax=Sphenostylis stenocarpa TaxID=92480 RepID=A0AA86S3L3_9FABA|nr:unnamed protein product [Sphenostylis stenocarpa]